MAHFVSGIGDSAHQVGVGIDGVTGDESRRPDFPSRQHLREAFGRHRAELAARDRAGGGSVQAAEPYRDRVEVERQAYGDVGGHRFFPPSS